MVSQFISIPVVVLVNPTSNLKSLKDIVAVAKAKNDELRFGGVLGSSAHLGPDLFALDQGFKFKPVPYRGGAMPAR
jgi:tripartite-type tricarboxylate transporter receptor subunit TctC